MGRPFEPFAQGDFDSLCGVHAIINALYGLCPDMSDRHAEALFNRLIAAIAIRRSNPLQVVWRGMDGSLLRHLLELAIEYVEQKYSIKLTQSRIGQETQRLSLHQVIEALGQRLEAGALAIVLLGGRSSHWTVAYKVTSKKIRLLDSNDRRSIRRKHCTLAASRKHHRLVRREIVLVSKLPQAIR
jgi:hypothetical protein